MFPSRFPSLRDSRKASVFLTSLWFCRLERVQGGRRAPYPPIRDHRGSHGLPWPLRFSGDGSRGEPSGEQEGKRAPYPPIRDHRRSHEPALLLLLRFSGVASCGEPSGEQTAVANSHRPRRVCLQGGTGKPGRDGRRPSVAQAVRHFCLACCGAASSRNAFDCLSQVCPLYVCMPFRRIGRRRASKGLVAAYCRHCQPGDTTDCQREDCALHPWRPWQPGGQPKVRRLTDSQKQRLRQIGQSSQFAGARQ